MCDEADYSYEVLSERRRRARVTHACYACGEVIRVSDVYAATFCVGRDGTESYCHCLRCEAMLKAIRQAHLRQGINIGIEWGLDCGNDWKDVVGDLPDDVAMLAFMTADEMQASCAPKDGAT